MPLSQKKPTMKPTMKPLVCGLITALSTFTSHAALVAHWDFNNANDSVSSTAGTTVTSSTISGGKLNLTGTGGFDANTRGGLGGAGSFTVAAQFTTSNALADQAIFSYSPTNGATGGSELRLFAQANGNLRIEMTAGAGFEANLGTLNLNDGLTHRIAAIFESPAGNSFRDVVLYVDGTTYAVTSGTDHLVNLLTTGSGGGVAEVSFGYQLHNPTNRTFTGTMDFIQIHNSALTVSQLNAIPEPTAALLGGLGLLSLLRRRR